MLFRSVNANGSAGSLSWPDNCGKIEPGWWLNDFNMDFKDVATDFTTGFIPGGGSGTNAYILTGINHEYVVNGNFKLTGSPKTILVIGGEVKLWVKGNLSIPATWEVKIEPGSVLKLYVGDTTGPAVSGDFGKVSSSAGPAATFQYYGLPTNDSVTWGGNNEFRGTVYAPQATFKLNGGGSGTFDYMGACVVNQVVMVGKFQFHYDEALKRKDPYAGYTAGTWREL